MRKILRRIALSLFILISTQTLEAGLFSIQDTLASKDISLRVTDESGKNISYVTVLAIQYLPTDRYESSVIRPDSSDMTRIASRYIDSYYYVSPSHNIIDDIQLVGLTDENGTVSDKVIFEFRNNKPVSEAYIAYAFFKDGFQHKVVDVFVERDKSYNEKVVTLSRITGESGAGKEEYEMQEEFDRLRYMVENIRSNLSLSIKQRNDLETARTKLLDLAVKAEKEKETELAARIFAWMQYMPEIVLDDTGKPYKYTQVNPESDRNLKALQRAVMLMPTSSYLQAESLFYSGAEISRQLLKNKNNQQLRDRFKNYLENLEELLAKNGGPVWPYAYVATIGANERLGRYDRAYAALRRARSNEPHYLDYNKLYEQMKLREKMKLFQKDTDNK